MTFFMVLVFRLFIGVYKAVLLKSDNGVCYFYSEAKTRPTVPGGSLSHM